MPLQLSDFDFDLPPDRIALRPARPRDAARLMVVEQDRAVGARAMAEGAIGDRAMTDLPALLRPGDLLVFNDTRVISARLSGRRLRGASDLAVEATLLRRLSDTGWSALMRPGKRLQPRDRLAFGEDGSLRATLAEKRDGGEVALAFDVGGEVLDRAIARAGVMPLPPYIAAKRDQDAQDRTDYQTVYAAHDGSVAAPTAGLHFTPELLAALEAAGVGRTFVTLHVGAGTFLPVKVDRIEDHLMHAEAGEVSAAAAAAVNAARAAGGRIVCVGTTSLRLLESALDADGRVAPFAGETDIFLRPGVTVRSADALLTNFHLPRSTLLMLVAAFAGLETMRAGYAHALANAYRFYSYGDAGLWFRQPQA